MTQITYQERPDVSPSRTPHPVATRLQDVVAYAALLRQHPQTSASAASMPSPDSR